MISGIVDFSDHNIAARIGRNGGRSVVSQIHAQPLRHRRHTGSPGSPVKRDSQIAKSDRGDGLVECLLRAQSNRIDLNKFRRDSLDSPMLPPCAIASIGDELDTIDAGETHTIGGQWHPCAAGAYPRTCGPDAGIQIRKELQCDSIRCGTHKIHGTQSIERKSAERIRRACSRSHSRRGENGACIAVRGTQQRPVGRSGSIDDIRRAYDQSRGIDQPASRTTNDAAIARNRRLHTYIIS